MVLGWRRAFCTSIPKDRDNNTSKQEQSSSSGTISTPKSGSKFSFFSSNPSTPRLKTTEPGSGSGSGLRCSTTATVPTGSSVPESPKLQCKTMRNSPRFFQRSSNPSSPRSPSTFSLLKSSLRLSKSRCGICLQSVKTGQGMAIFTAECSHSFHFPCIATHVKKQGSLACPICSSLWKEMPVLSLHGNHKQQQQSGDDKKREKLSPRVITKQNLRPDLKVYNDDEPLTLPTTGARFNPIPESDENLDEDSVEFQGFFVNGGNNSPIGMNSCNVEVRLLPEAAVVSVGRSHETYAIVLRIKAPKAPTKAQRRAPIDLVTVLDVGGGLTNEKLQMMKRTMRLVVSSLSSSDRVSIVAFSATSKRLLPLRRMTTTGRRSARRIVDAIAWLDGTSSTSDALKKAVKVLEDRREKNTVASILLLSDGQDNRSSTTNSVYQRRQSSFVCSTLYAHMEFPVHSLALSHTDAYGHAPSEDGFAKCVASLISVMVQDLRLQLGFVTGSAPAEIAAVYSYSSRPVALGSGSVRVGDFYAEEERELLVELKVPSTAIGTHHVLSVRCSHRDPSSQEVVYGKEQALLVPRPHAVRSSAPTIQRLKYLFISTRAIAEYRRLADRNDLTGAHHMLASARALLLQSTSATAEEFVRSLETELAELQRKRQSQTLQQQQIPRREVAAYVDEKGEPLTPTSAWRAAERLAKVAIMRKSLNRVSDLHGFEDARF